MTVLRKGQRPVDDREHWLVSAIVELADTDSTGFDEVVYARSVATHMARLLAPAEASLLVTTGTGHLTAASTPRAADLIVFEASRGEGPGADSCRHGRPVLNVPLTTARARWPRFAAAASAAGFRMVSGLPLRRHQQTFGAVSIFSVSEHPLANPDVALAQILAKAATIAIEQGRALRQTAQKAEQLQRALDTRVLIEQAKGAVAARLGITPEEAFGLLRGYARHHNQLLTEVADAAIRGQLPVPVLMDGSARWTAPQASRRSNRTGRPAVSRDRPLPSA